jgi:hypothetical protein
MEEREIIVFETDVFSDSSGWNQPGRMLKLQPTLYLLHVVLFYAEYVSVRTALLRFHPPIDAIAGPLGASSCGGSSGRKLPIPLPLKAGPSTSPELGLLKQ